MIVDLDKLKRAREYIEWVDSLDLRDVVWVRGGVAQPVADKDVEDFAHYTVMANHLFAQIYLEDA